jgi:hypothetical protein
MNQSLRDRYPDLIAGVYDSVDRVVFNGYLHLAATAGGMRTLWRIIFGSDDDLSTKRLEQLAGDFARRVRHWATVAGIPVLEHGDRLGDQARELRPKDPAFTGVFCVVVSRCPDFVWNATRQGAGLHLFKKRAWVNHYTFHIIDADVGHISIKLCGWPPFSAQIAANGHEYISQQLARQGPSAERFRNSFADPADNERVRVWAQLFETDAARAVLCRVFDRWIYSACLIFALDLEQQQCGQLRYDYSVYQGEYSRNFQFVRGQHLDDFFQDLIDRLRRVLDIRQLKTIFGHAQRPRKKKSARRPELEVVVERSEYGTTILLIHFGLLTLKIYTKGEGLLRMEAIVHNTRELQCGRSLRNYAEIITRLRAILVRFVDVVTELAQPWIGDQTLEALPQPSEMGPRRIAGVDLNKPRVRAVLEALLALAAAPQGFTVAELAERACLSLGQDYPARRAAYDLRKFRAKRFVERVAGTTRYQVDHTALRPLAALFILRRKVISPLLIRQGHLREGRPPKHQTPVDAQYHVLQKDLRHLFALFHFAA